MLPYYIFLIQFVSNFKFMKMKTYGENYMTIKLGVAGLGYVSTCFLHGLSLHKKGEDVWTCLSNPIRNEIDVPLKDIELVKVFEIDPKKIGKNVNDVIRSYYPTQPDDYKGIKVEKGVCAEDVSSHVIKNAVSIWDDIPKGDTEKYLRERMKGLDVLVIASTTEPMQDNTSSKIYTLYALKEGVSVINGIPTQIQGTEEFDYLAREQKAVLFGNDFASGATPLTHDLLCHLAQHGRIPLNIAQWQYASNNDFLSLSDSSTRGKSKKISKSKIISQVFPNRLIPQHIGIDFIQESHLDPDTKHVYLNIHYQTFAGTRNYITVTAQISDSPSASVLIGDLIRLVPLAKKKGDYVPEEANAFYFKSPKKIYDSRIDAFNRLLKWIKS